MGGIFELPSGKVEEGETLEGALSRELKEETGLTIKKIINYISSFDYVSKSGKKTRQFNFLIEVKEPIDIKLNEHETYKWIDKVELDKFNVTDSVKEALNLI